MSGGFCQGCGTPIPPSRGRGRPRKWCSQNCRRVASYGGVCEVCGGRTNGSNGPGTAAKVCQDCLTWTREAVIDAMRRWAEEHGGIPPRSADWRLAPDGYPSAQCAAIRQHGWNELLLEAGFSLRCDRRPETQRWVEDQVRAGRAVQEIADELGLTTCAIYLRLRVRGLSVRALRESA